LPLVLDIQADSIIKVMGVGGGGCNSVNYMYKQGIKDVSYLVCNTDQKALAKSSVPAKLQLGPGHGAGGKPEKAQELAEADRDRIREALDDGTKMLFLTAGMGGGTGTGAGPIVAEVAQEMGILTVGIVTIPFAFEGKPKIRKAMTGVAKLAEHVDALLVINNQKLIQIYPDLNLLNAFTKSDDVVCNAAKSIAEIITVTGHINTDFQDVYNTLKDGNVAIMNVGIASGEQRIKKAIEAALHSPLVNTNDVHGAKRVLLQFYCSTEHAIENKEAEQIMDFIQQVGDEVEVQWGLSIDEELGEQVRVTIIATGYEVSDIPSLNDVEGKITIEAAMDAAYAEPLTKKPEPQPKEDEIPQEIDLTDSVKNRKPQPNPSAHRNEKHPSTSDEQIKITFDEEADTPTTDQPRPDQPQDLKKTTEEKSHGIFAWMRGKRE